VYRPVRRHRRWRHSAVLSGSVSLVLALGTAASTDAAAATAVVAGARAAAGGTWGTAKEVAGALNTGKLDDLESVSCASAGSCSAGGYYEIKNQDAEVFVINEKNGTWGTAEEVPGTAALNTYGEAQLFSVSCASAGNCSAGGYYEVAGGKAEAFVVNEVNGTWSNAEEVPGTATLNTGGIAQITSVSCPSVGNCTGAGLYTGAPSNQQVFVVNETNGTWGNAKEVPGIAALNTGESAQFTSVSCTSAGNCSAGGYYTDKSTHAQAFVVNEVSGSWGNAEEVPGTATLNAGGEAVLNWVSCASAGNCSGGGYYSDKATNEQAFVVNEANGTWSNAEEVPGTATLNAGGEAEILSVSCTSAGNCSAGGYYADKSGDQQALVVNETNGTWGNAEEIPGAGKLNSGLAQITSLSCTSTGNCGAGGNYTDKSGNQQALVVNEVNGTWGTAEEVPGTAKLNSGGLAAVESVSCGSASHCSGVGYYSPTSSTGQVFVVNET
jgi:D-alanine-D-alanine ligase-like ATP-grasp enzyme